MTFQSTTTTTARTDLVNAWKEVYMPLQAALNFDCEELELLDTIGDVNVDWSTYKTIMPVDIYEGYGAGAVAEGGYKTIASSQSVLRAEIDVQHYNAAFTQSELAQWANAGLSNQVKPQLALQGAQKLNVLKRHLADYIHGTSVGTLALTDTDISSATSATLTLKAGYGNTGITDGTFITNLFRVGDRIVLVDGSSLVANSFGTITAITPATPSITVTFDGSVTVSNNDLKVIKANSKDATTLAAGSDYNRGIVGFQDAWFSTTVHALSSGTYANWSVASSSSSGGRFNGVKLRTMRDAIRNYAPSMYKPDVLMIDQGVERDAIAYERVALRFADSMDMEIDGSIRAKGTTIFDSRRVPPGYAAIFAKKSVGKIMLTPMPGQPGAGDAEKLEERSSLRFDLDVVLGTVVKCRKAHAVQTGLTTQ